MPAPSSLLLQPIGPLDADTCGVLRLQLAAAFSAGVTSLVVDLAGVNMCDPIGLGVLAGADRHLRRQGGALVVVHASDAIATSLRINELGHLLEVPSQPSLSLVAGSGAAEPTRHCARPPLSVVRPGA